MITRSRETLRLLGVILFVVLGLVIALAALLGGISLLLPVTTMSTLDVTVVARNADGSPAAGQAVELWGYEKAKREAVTGPDGRAEFPGETIEVVSPLGFPRRRPESFPVRIRFPRVSPLYYRYDVLRDGVPEADVFNTTYDYRFGRDWVGRFDGDGLVVRVDKDEYGRPAQRARPSTDDGAVQLFRPRATLKQLPGPEIRWQIELVLTPAGGWQAAGR
jgi:hypothetical protein